MSALGRDETDYLTGSRNGPPSVRSAAIAAPTPTVSASKDVCEALAKGLLISKQSKGAGPLSILADS